MTRPQPSRTTGWQRAFTSDLPIKLLALFTAMVLWFYSSADRRAIIEQSFDVAVTTRDNTSVEEDDVQRAVSGLTPPTIKVTLRGRPDRLGEMRSELIEAVVDVTDLPEGSFNQPVTVQPPAGTELVSTTPDRVQGLVDTVQQRNLPITVSVYDPNSAVMPNYQANPAEVSLSGPSRLVEAVEQVVYAPVTLGSGEEREINLVAMDENGVPVEGVALNPPRATLSRVDRGDLPVKTLAVQLSTPPANLRVTSVQLSPPQVRVVGSPETLSGLTQVVGMVDYRVGGFETDVRLLLPSGVQPLDTVKAVLTVAEVTPTSAPASASADAPADAPADDPASAAPVNTGTANTAPVGEATVETAAEAPTPTEAPR